MSLAALLLSTSLRRTLQRLVILLCLILILSTCNSNADIKSDSTDSNRKDTVIKHDTIYINNDNNTDWQISFELTHDPDKDSVWNRPVSYYLNDKECSSLAYDFYYGYFRPSDNGATDELLKYAVSENSKLRPFYRWCLNKTIQISDGALAEHVGIPARRYAEKFPKELFEYMDSDTSGQKYKDWASAISYSGFYEHDDYEKPNEIRMQLTKIMKSNCKHCESTIIKRIEQFARDCFK